MTEKMKGLLKGWLCCVVLSGVAGAANSELCVAGPTHHAAALAGEVYGQHDLVLDVTPELRLGLIGTQHGWRVSVQAANGNELMPPSPSGPGISPLDLEGWHFRNAANTGPNTGDVNAPQHLRTFSFRLPTDGSGVATGTGSLVITDLGLADLTPEHRARAVYLRFEACLTWPKTEAELMADANAASPDFLPEENELLRACGLSGEYALEALVLPRMLGGDFDGDDSLDEAVYLRRLVDGVRSVAICRAGTWLEVLGVDRPVPGDAMPVGFLQRVEAWRVSKLEDVPGGWVGESPRPYVAGDVLLLEIVDKALYSIYWDGISFRSHRHYRSAER